MIQTFRPRQALRNQGQAMMAIFGLLTTAMVVLPIYIKPGTHGFDRRESVVGIAILGGLVFGSMLLLSVLVLISALIERISIEGTIFRVRSLLQSRRFNTVNVERVRWRDAMGRIAVYSNGRKTILNIGEYHRSIRLQIIRALRAIIPEEKQEGWPMFCLKVALPLRDGKGAREFMHDLKAPSDPAAFILVTRRRYDRLLMFALPISVLVSLGLWWQIGKWQVLPVAPGFVLFWWLVIRRSVPSEGRREPTLRGSGIGWQGGMAILLLFLSTCCMAIERRIGASRETISTIGTLTIATSFPFLFWMVWRLARQEKTDQTAVAAIAVRQWAEGESNAVNT